MTSIVTRIQQINTGRKVLRQWKVNGAIPVPIEHAQARANICLMGAPECKPCPLNEPDSGWEWGKRQALAIADSLKWRRILNIKLEGDEDLHTCSACGCVLKLKVHTPIKFLIESPEKMDRYPDWCWIKTETTT